MGCAPARARTMLPMWWMGTPAMRRGMLAEGGAVKSSS